MQPLDLLALERGGFADGGQQLHFLSEFARYIRKSLGDFQAQAGHLLDHAINRNAVDGLSDFAFARKGRRFTLGVGGLAGGLDLFLNFGEILLNFLLSAAGAHGRFGCFGWHGGGPFRIGRLADSGGDAQAGWAAPPADVDRRVPRAAICVWASDPG